MQLTALTATELPPGRGGAFAWREQACDRDPLQASSSSETVSPRIRRVLLPLPEMYLEAHAGPPSFARVPCLSGQLPRGVGRLAASALRPAQRGVRPADRELPCIRNLQGGAPLALHSS
jgi:hypothetical protein